MIEHIFDRLLSRGATILIVVGIFVFAWGAAGEMPVLGGFPLPTLDARILVGALGLVVLSVGVMWLRIDERPLSSNRGRQANDRVSGIRRANYNAASTERSIVRQKIAMLGDLSGSYRVEALKDIAPALPGGTRGHEAKSLLGDLSISYRRDGIGILAPKLATDLSESEVEELLGDLWGSYQQDAIQLLHQQHNTRGGR